MNKIKCILVTWLLAVKNMLPFVRCYLNDNRLFVWFLAWRGLEKLPISPGHHYSCASEKRKRKIQMADWKFALFLNNLWTLKINFLLCLSNCLSTVVRLNFMFAKSILKDIMKKYTHRRYRCNWLKIAHNLNKEYLKWSFHSHHKVCYVAVNQVYTLVFQAV